MKRRNFVYGLGLAGLSIPLQSFSATAERQISTNKKLLPKRLSKGDTIGITSPAGAIFDNEPYEIARENLEAMGLNVKFGEFAKSRYGHLAGTDEERASELNQMFGDPEIDAIISLRGGSGAARIIDKLDYELIRKNPKIFIGYSDITALHLSIYEKTGLVTFHGPMASSSWNTFNYDIFHRLLFEGEMIEYTNPENLNFLEVQTGNRIRTINNGNAQGELLGGNLSVLTSIMGTPYFPTDWSNKILYLEDIGEKIYAVDRMMSQLKLGGILDKISGFVFGKCTGCDPGGSGYGSLTMEEVIDHYIKPLNIPAFSGAMIGHIDDNSTIPNGIEAEINSNTGTIKLLKPAVK